MLVKQMGNVAMNYFFFLLALSLSDLVLMDSIEYVEQGLFAVMNAPLGPKIGKLWGDDELLVVKVGLTLCLLIVEILTHFLFLTFMRGQEIQYFV